MSIVAAVLAAMGLVYELGKIHQHEEWVRMHPHAQTNLAPVAVNAPPTPAPASITPPQPALAEVSETEFQSASFRYMLRYDFGGMENWIRQHDWPGKSSNTLADACPRLDHLVTWARQQMQNYSPEKPLKILGKERMIYYWPAPFGGVMEKIVPNGTPQGTQIRIMTVGPDQIQPLGMANIIRQLLKDDKEPPGPATAQLDQELRLFIKTYHLAQPNRNASATVKPANPGP